MISIYPDMFNSLMAKNIYSLPVMTDQPAQAPILPSQQHPSYHYHPLTHGINDHKQQHHNLLAHDALNDPHNLSIGMPLMMNTQFQYHQQVDISPFPMYDPRYCYPRAPVYHHMPQRSSTSPSQDTLSTRPVTKKYSCRLCNKRFTRPSSLNTHMYSHTGEKPFKCHVEGCGRNFSVVSNLRRHAKIHIHTETP